LVVGVTEELLGDERITEVDSLATANHPMIDGANAARCPTG
jgi:hypothetical protein